MNPDGTGLVEYPLPHPDSAPRIIALGADGNMWFSEHTGNRIGRITPAGVITEFDIPTPASQPRAISLGADGNIWFGMFAAGKIGRITPAGVITEFAIPTPNSGPRALATGPDGNVWVSEYRASKIARITPQGVITEFVVAASALRSRRHHRGRRWRHVVCRTQWRRRRSQPTAIASDASPWMARSASSPCRRTPDHR